VTAMLQLAAISEIVLPWLRECPVSNVPTVCFNQAVVPGLREKHRFLDKKVFKKFYYVFKSFFQDLIINLIT